MTRSYPRYYPVLTYRPRKDGRLSSPSSTRRWGDLLAWLSGRSVGMTFRENRTRVARMVAQWFTQYAFDNKFASKAQRHALDMTLNGTRSIPIFIKVKDYVIKNSDNKKLSGVAVDGNPNFSWHLENILKKS